MIFIKLGLLNRTIPEGRLVPKRDFSELGLVMSFEEQNSNPKTLQNTVTPVEIAQIIRRRKKMDIELIQVTTKEAQELWKMQVEAFKELYAKYKDTDTSPATEPLSKTIDRLNQEFTYFYFIIANGKKAGAIRVVDMKNREDRKKISPIFVMPQFRNMGIAQRAILEVERIHGSDNWFLDTILQEKGNCHLYEKMGYVRNGDTWVINDRMTLIGYIKN